MQQMTYKGIKVQYDDSITEEEARELTRDEKRDWWENLNKIALGYLTITREGNEIVLHGKEADKIERLARITGYLSNTSRWNNGKVGELRDRIKHI